MTDLLTAAQMRAIEKAAIDSGEVTGLELMERAGQGVVEAIFEEWPVFLEPPERGPAPAPPKYLGKDESDTVPARRAVVLCGPGKNGGDGFVVARLLHARGWAVEVFLYGDPEKLPPDARLNYERWLELGAVQARSIDPPPLVDDTLPLPTCFELIVDGLFGIGLTRPFKGLFSFLAHQPARAIIQDRGVRVVAIDTPSGLCSDSGHVLGKAIEAGLTVTFHRPKLGHFLGEGPGTSGTLVTKDIGLADAYEIGYASCAAIEQISGTQRIERCVCRLAQPPLNSDLSKESEEHKYSHGHALILSGPSGKTGAARLAARGALRIGAGLVTLGVPQSAWFEVASQITALMMAELESAEDLAAALEDDRINALCLGPGLGLERAWALVPVALSDPTRHVVLDADVLSAYADDPTVLFGMLHENCVLTPHAGEFARLFPDIADKLVAPATKGPAYSKVDATREAGERAGCTVLLKGQDTVIASPSGVCAINAALYERSAPWLATAGSGDVLAGFITGLVARGFSPQSAAETAAWLHVECARSFGPGLVAEDLPEELPKVFKELAFQKQ
ncbi:NAD(P)H-hydrate dehydratase [Epibacterium ulvae]|uniref:NAD(P)H-hydrate dehydratase n=1 Tax=Epibacterium ulvae TaxID=1156985 RepID=UPI001BFC19B6|nr:NAD(P)H-hydrate dehydratase [Epibacterium ulvae]MBT8155387.1 NAD(P)H-hydrate dehydratase [Epibacterium ulvae]